MRLISGFTTTALMLVALYLGLRHAAGGTKLIGATATGASKVFRTLQGR
jgi:hypothetical protein